MTVKVYLKFCGDQEQIHKFRVKVKEGNHFDCNR